MVICAQPPQWAATSLFCAFRAIQGLIEDQKSVKYNQVQWM